MRYRLRVMVAALGLFAVTAVTAGCGVPGSGPPVVVGAAPRLGARTDTTPVSPAGPERANDAQQLVDLYLQAAAWGNAVTTDRPRAVEEAAERARRFLTPQAASQWRPGTRLTVVQRRFGAQATLPNRAVRVDVTLQTVGVLTNQGSVLATPPVSVTYPLEVMPSDDGHGRINNPPDGMLLSSEGLRLLYETEPVYFWDTLGRTLVPDLRYLAKAVEQEKRPNEVVSWLLEGASSWLRPAVLPLPPGVELRDRVVARGSSADSPLLVNLTAKAAGVDPDQLRRLLIQLQWSLRPFGGPVQLSIEGRSPQISVSQTELARANRAVPAQSSVTFDPLRYCVVGGQVRPVAGQGQTVPAIPAEINTQVLSAAINSSQSAALVRPDQPGWQRLWITSLDRGDLASARYLPTDMMARAMSRPVWLSAPSAQVLVAADDAVWVVSPTGQSRRLSLPDKTLKVSAVAVAPDGRRLALISGGRVYLAPLLFDADTEVQVGQGYEVASGLTENVGVAFSREDRLIAAGRNGATAGISEVTVDGAVVELLNLNNISALSITRVVAYPLDPTKGIRGIVMIEANDQAYHVYSGQVEQVTVEIPVAPTPVVSGSATPQPVTPPVPASVPIAPFFVD